MTGYSQSDYVYRSLCDATTSPYFRRSAEWVPNEMAGIASSCTSRQGVHVIYPRTAGMIPFFAGHVPGEKFTCGHTYTDSTVDAKRWLELNKL